MTRSVSGSKRVAVVGAGPCGLTAIKCCKEENIDVVCFEKTDAIGGLWRYHEDDKQDLASVTKTTVINTSKELTAFSDFPPPKEFANFMHNTQILRYLEQYAENFNLYQHIRYQTEVVKIERTEDYEESGRWIVTTRNAQDNEEQVDIFDGVLICTGHHVYPHVPRFPGQEEFHGKIIHTHSLKTFESFNDLNVLVVGVGNSGIDAAVDISNVAKQVYLSTRSGTWLTPKVGYKGLPFDTMYLNRFYNMFFNITGWKLASLYFEHVVLPKTKLDLTLYGLEPKHHYFSQHASLNDILPTKILSGTIVLKKNLETFTKNGGVFCGDKKETPFDAVVLATGYDIKYTLLSEDIIKIENNKVNLYKNAFFPNLKHPTLAVIGLIQPTGCIFPIAESQCRWFAQLMNKKVKLPSAEDMKADILKTQKALGKRFVSSQRHTIQVDFINFMDDLAKQYGSKPKLLKYFFTDPSLFWACFVGPCTSYQYRLDGPHSWPRARRTILKVPERVTAPFQKTKKINQVIYFYEFWILCGTMLLFIFAFVCSRAKNLLF